MDVAIRARYQQATAASATERGKWRMSDPLLRYFTRAFQPFASSREAFARASFSIKINELQNPLKSWGSGCGLKLIR
jgi:hypothetical protein